MVRQVFMEEREMVGGSARVRTRLAFGDHPDIEEEDDRVVTSAVARGQQRIRIVFDELIRGNAVEVIGCADGSFSVIPTGTDPDDILKCSGPQDAIVDSCQGDHAVCVCEDPDAACAADPGLGMPIGILDENEDGAADDFRMREYGGGELAAVVTCGGVNIPMDPELSFYNPSGNQLIPAGPIGIDGLGPAIILEPLDGLMTGAKCTISFQATVVDKDGNEVCAPPNGDISASCTPGDTEAISFDVEPLGLVGSAPSDGGTVSPIQEAGGLQSFLFEFNAGIDEASTTDAITVSDGSGDVPITTSVTADDPTIVQAETDDPCCASGSSFTVDISTGITDLYGGALPEAIQIAFDVEPLELDSSDPADCDTDVELTDGGAADKTITLEFNAAIDDATTGAVTLSDGNGAVAATVAVSAADPTVVTMTVAGGLTADTIYTVDIADTLADILGGVLPEATQFSFATGATAPNGCDGGN